MARTTPKRRVIQIGVGTSGQGGEQWPVLFALCDDGTIWQRSSPEGWHEIDDVPQDGR